MAEWDGWPLDRTIVAFSALLYAGIWVQVSLFHWAGAFRKTAMWGPVAMTPLIVIGILIAVAARDGIFGWIGAAALALGVVDGLVGIFYHFRAIEAHIGGFSSVRNFMNGPPPVLPLAFSLVGVLGLTALLWNA